MANSAKNKGDRYEREAVSVLVAMAPDLVLPKASPMFGAGRKDDVGDLRVFKDVTIQVRALKAMGQALRSSAEDSVIQSGHGDTRFALGMVPVQGARKTSVRWLCSVAVGHWPGRVDPVPLFEAGVVSKVLDWVKADATDREARIALLKGPGQHTLVAPLEAWLAAYRQVLDSTVELELILPRGLEQELSALAATLGCGRDELISQALSDYVEARSGARALDPDTAITAA
jgi:hypothetical protein